MGSRAGVSRAKSCRRGFRRSRRALGRRKWKVVLLSATGAVILFIGLGVVTAYLLRESNPQRAQRLPAQELLSSTVPPGVFTGTSGPWGMLTWQETYLEPPDEYMTPDLCPGKIARWVLPGYSYKALMQLVESAGFEKDQVDFILSHSHCDQIRMICTVTPDVEFLKSIKPSVRATMYKVLASFEDNFEASNPIMFKPGQMEVLLKSGVLPDRSRTLLMKLLYTWNGYSLFADIAAVCSLLPTPEEKVRFMRGVFSSPSLLVRLQVKPEADVKKISDYWNAYWSKTSVIPLLKALRRLPGGGER